MPGAGNDNKYIHNKKKKNQLKNVFIPVGMGNISLFVRATQQINRLSITSFGMACSLILFYFFHTFILCASVFLLSVGGWLSAPAALVNPGSLDSRGATHVRKIFHCELHQFFSFFTSFVLVAPLAMALATAGTELFPFLLYCRRLPDQ